jgi:ABC-type ATPase involved in cell division
MPILTEQDHRLVEISTAADYVVLKLRIMQRAKNPQEHRAELRQRLHEFVDKCMQFADACDGR